MNDQWISVQAQPPAPGDYLTRRILRIERGPHGLRRKTISFSVVGHFDGQRWNMPETPDEYREIPEGEKA
jgi:hypothetical protein